MKQWIEGGAVTGVGALSLLSLVAYWQRKRRPVVESLPDTELPPETYQVASARPTQEFLAGLAKLARELRELALEESWKIDWAEHDRAVAAAREALDRKQVPRALSEIGKTIDSLMLGLHAHRKKMRLAKLAEAQQQAAEEPEPPEHGEHDAERSVD